jgi:hypothetical protein
MDTVSTLLGVFASCAPELTARTLANLAVLLRGAILAVGSRTVASCLVAAWPWVGKHFSAYENVGRRARLPMLAMARWLFRLVLLLVPDGVVELATDDTLVRRFGRHVVGLGLFRDAVASSHAHRVTSPGHKWVTLAVVVRLPFCARPFALPVLSVLCGPSKPPKRSRAGGLYRSHRTPPELALLMVRIVVRWAPGRRFRLLGDGGYATHELAAALSPASRHERLRVVSLVSRFLMKAASGRRCRSARGRASGIAGAMPRRGSAGSSSACQGARGATRRSSPPTPR